MCFTSRKTIKFLIAANGIPILVQMLDPRTEYHEGKEILLTGVDCISRVFHLHINIPKNDFCRLFAQCGLLPRLARVLTHVVEDKESKASHYQRKIADIFFYFSRADARVKQTFVEGDVIKRLLRILHKLKEKAFVIMLKSIKNLSTHSSTLEPLSKAGAIRKLISFLKKADRSRSATEINNQILHSLFNLCTIEKTRQEKAARAGIIPHLQEIIRQDSPLKQFALPLICEIAHTKKARQELWKHDGVKFYISLWDQQYPWQVQALDAIARW